MNHTAPSQHWDDWNATGGPKYPKQKTVQFSFRRFPARDQRMGKRALDLGCGSGVQAIPDPAGISMCFCASACRNVWMDRHITTYAAGQMQQNEHLLTLVCKPD
jgi:hypothetical protein